MRKKHKMMDLRSLWEKAGKAQKTSPTPEPEPEVRAAPTAAPVPPSALLQRLRFILRQGLAFRVHDAIEDALRDGDFRELLKWMTDSLEGADKAVLQNSLDDPRMTCRQMVTGLVSACARETAFHIRQELSDDNFGILACAFGDANCIEHLAVCLRYVDRKGRVVERLLGVVPVENLEASMVKAAIGSLLRDNSLSWSRVRGQGYDGVGSMRAHMKGLKKLIMDEYPSAHYVHCFVQELHPALVCVLKEHHACRDFFEQLEFLVSVLKISCRKPQMLGVAKAREALDGLDHEKTFRTRNDARNEFHYKAIIKIIVRYPTFRSVLCMVGEDSTQGTEAVNAQKILLYLDSFEFVFMAELLLKVLGITSVLNNSLLMRDEFIINGIGIIDIAKHLLEELRGLDGWEKFLKDVTTFCAKHEIKIPSMDDIYEPALRSKRFSRKVNNLHHYHVEIFTSVLDRQIREFNDRFDEVNIDFLHCVASIDPANSFMQYDYYKDKLVKLASFYPKDFSKTDLLRLPIYLEHFIADMRMDERFRKVKSFVELSVMLVETKKSLKHFVVHKLLKLVLVLPIATASVERVFSAMDLVKNKLRYRAGEQLLNDCFLTFIEREIFSQVKDEALISRFQAIVGG